MGFRKKSFYMLPLLFFSFLAGYWVGSELEKNPASIEITPVFTENYLPTVLEIIQNAQKSIKVIMFETAYYEKYPESASNRILEALKEKAAQGIDVKLIMEGGEKFLGRRFKEEVQDVLDFFKDSKVKIKCDPRGKNTHAKFILVDGEYLLIGSTNWTYYGLTKNNETNVLIKDRKLCRKFEKYFNTLWNLSSFPAEQRDYTTVRGTITKIEKRISRKGSAYELIYLDNGLKLFLKGHYDYKKGDQIEAEGYVKFYKGQEELEVKRIRKISF